MNLPEDYQTQDPIVDEIEDSMADEIEEFFSTPLSRRPYLIWQLSIALMSFFSSLGAYDGSWKTDYYPFHFFLCIVLSILSVIVASKRVIDLGQPRKHVFLAFVPLYNIYYCAVLFFMEKQPEDPLVSLFVSASGKDKRICPHCGEKIQLAAVV